MTKRYETALVWFRRDLRSHDHAALFHGLKSARRVHCVFVFDSEILDPLADRCDRRVEFIWRSVQELARSLHDMGGGLHVLAGRARILIPALVERLRAQAVYINHDYEPAANARDADVRCSLERAGCALNSCKDHAMFDKEEILTQNGRPFTVFTPYKTAWLKKLSPFFAKAYPVETYRAALARSGTLEVPSLERLGFRPTNLEQMKLPTGMSGGRKLFQEFLQRMDAYDEARNHPAIRGVSYLSVHLRFGTLSIRELVRAAVSRGSAGAQTWLAELVWRDFYLGILHHFPHVVVMRSSRSMKRCALQTRSRIPPPGAQAVPGIPWLMPQ